VLPQPQNQIVKVDIKVVEIGVVTVFLYVFVTEENHLAKIIPLLAPI